MIGAGWFPPSPRPSIDRTAAETTPSEPSATAGLVFALVVGALVRFGVVWGVDLQGAFGPDAPGAAAAAITGPLEHPYPLHPILIRVFSLLVGEPVSGALFLSLLAGFFTVAAGWYMGRLLFGEHGGRATGAVVATAPVLVEPSLLRGGDALALALAWWGVALAWRGAVLWSLFPNRRRAVALVLGGGLLVGVSAAAKPVALPAAAFLLMVPVLGGASAWPLLAGALLIAAGAALPFLDPLVHPIPGAGLLGSWWQPPIPGDAAGWLQRLAQGADALRQLGGSSWSQAGLLAVFSVLGALVGAPRRPRRVLLLVLGALAIFLLGVIMGERLRPRYLAAGTLGWALLTGFAVTPRAHRRPGAPGRQFSFLQALPLSLGMTVPGAGTLRYWEGIALVRVEEEGAASPRGPFSGWDPSFRPVQEWSESSVCGALGLERMATVLQDVLPRGAVLAYLPLRDGREWHLTGPLAAQRPDLELVPLTLECCPSGPESCAASLAEALSRRGGGLVAPLADTERCETGAVPAGQEPWVEALDPLLEERWRWYGYTVAPAGVGGASHLCTALGGRAPPPPARP